MNKKETQAYNLLKDFLAKENYDYDKVERCTQESNDEFDFEMGHFKLFLEENIGEPYLFKVNILTQKVVPINVADLIKTNQVFPQGKEINPEIFNTKQIFNL